ncbi:MAG TPA: protein kinase [Steroidobacteraceae bacterium]|nr:protein kinase [Steroidobacteraceae bacterium]
MSIEADLRGRALRIFEQVADMPAAQRTAELDVRCEGDARLRAQVEALLAADAQQGEPFTGNAARWSSALRDGGAGAGAELGDQAMLGRNVGAWRLLEVIGHGGMGAVYRAQRVDGAYEQQAALKLIRSTADSPAARERFLRERQMLARLQHPHIATLLDGGFSADGAPYFVMEHVAGVPIDQWCDQHRLGIAARVELFAQVLDAVAYAHRNLLVHRDLKPSNLLVDANGQVKLLDFGVAKQLLDANLTAFDDRVLTLRFASPEQLRDAPITTATDIWQLGIVLQLLLTGAHPFGLDGDASLARQVQLLEREPTVLTKAAAQAGASCAALRGGLTTESLARELRGPLSTIVRSCLQREAESRYRSVAALAEDLQRWREHRPLLIAPVNSWTATRLWLRRHLVAATTIAAVVAALLAGTSIALWQAREARAQARIAQRESANARATMRFLSDTLAAAAPEQALDTEVSVRTLLDKARVQLERRDAVDPAVRQPMQRLLGHLYASLNDKSQAVALFKAGMDGVQPQSRAEAVALADDLVAWSDVLADMEELQESLALSLRAAALRRQYAPDDPEQQLRAMAHLNLAHLSEYGIEACEKQAEQALARALAMPDPPTDVVVDIYFYLSALADFKVDGKRELAMSDAGLAYADAHGVPADSPRRGTLLRYKAEALMTLGQPSAAEAVVRQNLAAIEKTGSGGHTPSGVLYKLLSSALQAQGRYREALDALQQCKQLMPVPERGPRNRAALLMGESNLSMVLGDYVQALALADQGMAEFDRGGISREDPYRRFAQVRYLEVLLAGGKLAQARELLQEMRETARRVDGETSLRNATLAVPQGKLWRQSGDAGRARQSLAEARENFLRLGLPPADSNFAALLREEAALARMSGDLAAAEKAQREALLLLQGGPNPTSVAIARAELADILAARGDRSAAQKLLQQALPVLRAAVLPQEASRAAAETLVTHLGL